MNEKPKRVDPEVFVRSLWRGQSWLARALPSREALRLMMLARDPAQPFQRVQILRLAEEGDPRRWEPAPGKVCTSCRGSGVYRPKPAPATPAVEAA